VGQPQALSTYPILGLLVVTAAVAFVVGVRVGRRCGAPFLVASRAANQGEPCCASPPSGGTNLGPSPKLPTGRPCVLELGSDGCEACRALDKVLATIAPRLRGKVALVRIDTDRYPQEAVRWRLRLIPTLIFLDAQGKEVRRHEGYLPADQLLKRVASLGPGRPSEGP
jgi:thioredoxin 1